MADSIANRIARLKEGKLTKSQRKLLEYFETADAKKILYMSITELAEEVDMAEATVLRFCRSLGFSGYQEFKFNLAQGVVNIGYRDSAGIEYVADIAETYERAMENCRKNLSQAVLQKASDMILGARTVSCYGAGNSHLAALELHSRLMRMGLLSYCESDAHFQNVLISSRNESDLLVLFSVSGGTKDVIEAAEIARASGMKILVITCYDKSPLARYADLVLSSAPMESPREPGAMSSKVMQLFMVDVLCTGLHRADKTRFDHFVAKSSIATSGKLV